MATLPSLRSAYASEVSFSCALIYAEVNMRSSIAVLSPVCACQIAPVPTKRSIYLFILFPKALNAQHYDRGAGDCVKPPEIKKKNLKKGKQARKKNHGMAFTQRGHNVSLSNSIR